MVTAGVIDSGRVRMWLGRSTFLVLAASTALGWILAFHFRRDPQRIGGPLADPDELVEWGRLSVVVYRSLLDTSVLFATALVLLLLRACRQTDIDRRVMWSAFGAVAFSLVAVVTWRLVEYDDIWLIPVPNRTAFNGFLPPALSDQVAAFQVGDLQVRRKTYLAAAVLHLLSAPAALAVVGLCLHWSSRPERSRQHP